MVDILLEHFQRLSDTCRAYFQFEVLDVAVEMVFDEATEFAAVFNPYTISVVYLNHDTVISGHFNIYQVVVAFLQPLLNSFCYYVFVYHKRYLIFKMKE